MTVPANVTRFLFELIGESESLRVVEFHIDEAVSVPFCLDLVLAAENDSADMPSWVGKAGVLTLFHPQHPRVFHGEVLQAEQLDSGRRFTRYRLLLVPKFQLLQYRSGSRIFQELSVPRIIGKLFSEARLEGSDYRLELNRRYQPREYCVQYQETEFEFLSRLMEEEGIFYFFEHHQDRHVMVISDDNSVFRRLAHRDAIAFHPKGSMRPDREVVYRLDASCRIVPASVTLGDYDFIKPDLTLREDAVQPQQQQLEQYDYPGGFSEPAQGRLYAAIALDASRAGRQQVDGLSDSQWMASGYLFELKDHPNPRCNQEYLITRASHQGKQPQSLEEGAAAEGSSYHVKFNALPADVTYRPPHQHRKKPVEGAQTAFVTGPAGEEIYTDEYGRVKVQFHWDREGQYNEATSCWVRVSQGWTGKEWGAMVLPRVGEEVLVHFVNGDPDRPMITGRVYHSVNRSPYDLPANKTRTTFKTHSYPGGGGYNELRIEDKKGSEQIYVHAQKDVDVYIRNDHRELVEKDRHLKVDGDLFEAVKADRHQITGNNWQQKTGGTLHQSVGGDHQLKVSGSITAQAGRELSVKAGTRIVIQGGTQLTLKAGAGFIVLDPSGATIQGPMVRINNGGSAGSAGGAAPAAPDKPELPETGETGKTVIPKKPETPHQAEKVGFTQGTAQKLTLDAPASSSGAGFRNSSIATQETPLQLEDLTILCTDANGEPASGLHYTVRLPDGSTRGGTIDTAGRAVVSRLPPGEAEVVLGKVVDEREIQQIRAKIKESLNAIILQEKQEAERIENELTQKGLLGRQLEYELAKVRGSAGAIWGMLTGLKELSDLVNPGVYLTNAFKAAWSSYKLSDEKPFQEAFSASFSNAQFAELADVIGFDPRTISKAQLAEVQALANFIWEDSETRNLLLGFAGDYIAAQHSLEITEGGAGLATDVALDFLITALTLGAGATIVVASKLRHLNKFRQIGLHLKKLAKAFREKATFKKKTGQTGGQVDFELSRPDNHSENIAPVQLKEPDTNPDSGRSEVAETGAPVDDVGVMDEAGVVPDNTSVINQSRYFDLPEGHNPVPKDKFDFYTSYLEKRGVR
ncbi:MAG: type VI secretion system tip protein TssI/VgrG, partial [Ketobacteraceae bacterium]|nr:type VI secretion system tip protein TssI/VgrG [Ketobacteraceae bacterium]